jgi:hypothetical protein
MKHILKLAKENSHTNIILTCNPQRHDLPEWSCVNTETESFNRKLGKIMKKTSKYVTVMKTDSNREYFTRHGLHMNMTGKEVCSQQTAATSIALYKKKKIIIEILRETTCKIPYKL